MSGRRRRRLLPLPLATSGPYCPTQTSAASFGDSAAELRREWEVGFSRFFNYPPRSASTPEGLRYLHRRKLRSSGGTWMVAASSAVLAVAKADAVAAPVLTVAVSRTVYEEHYVCRLNFSWPQVSCVPQCPIRGSRVVFASYKDCSGQVQKFAVRFQTSDVAESFLDFVKETFKETTDISTIQNDFVCENSSPPELNASNETYHRFYEESNCEEPTTSLIHQMPALSYHQNQMEFPMQPVVTTNINTNLSGLPPSFTDLLNSCSIGIEKDMPQQEASSITDCASKDQEDLFCSAKEPSTSEQLGSTSDARLKAQIAKYMSDANFHEMLSKIEMVIDELGGDMSLDV